MSLKNEGSLAIVGTSSAHDYLNDTTAGRRFWPVTTAAEPSCDGLHDDATPAHYLCSRCFPEAIDRREVLADSDEDEYLRAPEEID